MESCLELTGPDGRNPMGYFAAIGALLVLARVRPERQPRLSWTVAPIPRPVLYGFDDIDEVVAALDEDRRAWIGSPALFFSDEVKFSAADQRRYLLACRAADDGGRSVSLATALVAEGAFAGKGDGKPTDLHFTAGQQRFLGIAQRLRDEITPGMLAEALVGPWEYSRSFPTFGWDVTDDRVYALSASNPSTDTKYTVPGADWLAFMGLPAWPVVRGDGQARTAGSGGSWKKGYFSWPLWSQPLNQAAVFPLLNADGASQQTAHLGVFRQMRSLIRRADQGGYGSFSPASVIWEAGV